MRSRRLSPKGRGQTCHSVDHWRKLAGMQLVQIEEELNQHLVGTDRRVVPSNLGPGRRLQVHSSSKALLESERLEPAQQGEIPPGLGTAFASSFPLSHQDLLALRLDLLCYHCHQSVAEQPPEDKMPQSDGEADESSKVVPGKSEVRERQGRCRDLKRWCSMEGPQDSKSAIDRIEIMSGHVHSGDRKKFRSVARNTAQSS